MKSRLIVFVIMPFMLFLFCSACSNNRSKQRTTESEVNSDSGNKYGGYNSQAEWGEHLVTISGCNDCHTPKKMSPYGPVPDTSLLLSGHPADVPPPDINRKEIESKGLAATSDLTVWVGPWGISYAANITPDETGIGSWSEAQFIRSIREGKLKGLENSRQLLPPMPWQELAKMTDGELKAIYAYLKSVKPVRNVVPLPLPPISLKTN